jgi:protein-tyrosine phosphatase
VSGCIAGRDRTGIVAAITLSLLGVDDDTIADDYALSDVAEEIRWNAYIRTHPEIADNRLQHFWISPRDAMRDSLGRLRATHGSTEDYPFGAGVTADHIDAMAAHLLRPE